MDWPASTSSQHHYVAPHRGVWSGTSLSVSAKRQRQGIKSGRASLTHITEQAYAGLNTKPRRIISEEEKTRGGVVVDVGLLGAASLVVERQNGGITSAAKEELRHGQKVGWTFTAEDDENFRLQPAGPVIPLFPATIKHHPKFYPEPIGITTSDANEPGPSLRIALDQTKSFLFSHPDLIDDKSILSLVSTEVSNMYNPSTYVPGLKGYLKRRWKRPREPSGDEWTEDEEIVPEETQTTPRADITNEKDLEPEKKAENRGNASHIPRQLQQERNEIYQGNVNKLVALYLRKGRRNSGSVPTSPDRAPSPRFSKVLARKLSGNLKGSQGPFEEAVDSDDLSDTGSIRKGMGIREDLEGREENEIMMLAFPMGENGSDLNLSSYTYTRPRRRDTSQLPQECRHRFEPTPVPSWSFSTPILQLSASHAMSPDDAFSRDNAIHLAVRTVTNVYILAISRPRRKILKVSKAERHIHHLADHMMDDKPTGQKVPSIPADMLEVTTIKPDHTGGRRIVDVQMHPTEWQCAVMVDDEGGVWRWKRGSRRLKYARREGLDEIICIRPAPNLMNTDGFFRVSWGLKNDTVLVCSAKTIQRIVIPHDGMEGTDAEPLLDLSRYLGIILAMEPGIRERGSGFTCVTTGEDILWLDELAGGRIMVRIPHHLGYDRSLKIKVEQFGTVNRAFITSTRTSRVLVSTLLADRQMPKILHDANLFDMDAKPSDHIEGLASVMLAGWHPWYHLIITFHSDGALQGSFATPDGGSQPALLQKDADRLLNTVKWPNALKVMAARSSIRPETAIESFDHHHKILDFRDLRRSLVKEVSRPPVNLDQVREYLNDLADVDSRDFLSMHDILVTSAAVPSSGQLPASSFLETYAVPPPGPGQGPSGALENFSRILARFKTSQSLAQTIDLSACIVSLNGSNVPSIKTPFQPGISRDAFLRFSKARHGDIEDLEKSMERQRFELERLELDLRNATCVVTARDLHTILDVSDGLAVAMDDLSVQGNQQVGDPYKMHYSVLQPRSLGDAFRIGSAEEEEHPLHHGGLRAVLSEWTIGEDPSTYRWQEPGYVASMTKNLPKIQRVILPLRGTTGAILSSQPTGRMAVGHHEHFSLPTIDVPAGDSTVMAMFPSTQGAPGPFGSRNNAFAKKKPIKKRVVGF